MNVSSEWLAMPTVAHAERSRVPKYAIDGNAFILHRGSEAFVAAKQEHTRSALLQHPGVRALSPSEVQELQASLPANFEERLKSLGTPVHLTPGDSGDIRLGDVVGRVTQRLGISECGACSQRKRTLNKLVIWPARLRRRRTRGAD